MKKFFTLIAVAVVAFAAQANVLSVCQGEYYSTYVPVYGYWFDTPGQTQQIYPADMLAEMAGGQITEISFLTLSNLEYEGYDFSSYTIKMSGGELTLAFKEVNELGFEEEIAMTGATVVATTTPEYGAPALTFVLDEPFQYNGGNLLVEVTVTEVGTYGDTRFWGMAMVDEDGYDIYTPTYIANENYYGDVSTYLSSFLTAADFTYTPGQVTPPEPTEQTEAPSISADTQMGVHAYFVTITESEPSDLYYRYSKDNGEWSDWTLYDGSVAFDEDGYYQVEAYAIAPGKTESLHVGCTFVVTPRTGLDELSGDKAVSSVRFFNLAGQEMPEANGLTIVVTTYTDGTRTATKVIK